MTDMDDRLIVQEGKYQEKKWHSHLKISHQEAVDMVLEKMHKMGQSLGAEDFAKEVEEVTKDPQLYQEAHQLGKE
jgi:tRNA A37 methylthiotransferase MiaB